MIVLPPEVKAVPEVVRTRRGETTAFTCLATGVGGNNFLYQWFFNNAPIVGEDASLLLINVINSVDSSGEYTCSVRNTYGGTGRSGVARLILGTFCMLLTILCIRMYHYRSIMLSSDSELH